MTTEYYLYYIKPQTTDGKLFEDLSWYSEEGELETALELYNKQSKDHQMRLYVIYRQNHAPKNIKKCLRTNVPSDLEFQSSLTPLPESDKQK
jgi:hypothetical protein